MVRKLVLTTIVILSLGFFVTNDVEATEVRGDQTASVGDQVILEIVARPPNSSSNRVQLSMNISGGAVVSDYISPLDASWSPALGTCSGSMRFMDNTLCVDLTKGTGNTISEGESLGALILNITSQENVEIIGYVDNGYLEGGTNFTPATGPLHTITIGSGQNTNPNNPTPNPGGGVTVPNTSGGSSSGGTSGDLPTTNFIFEDKSLSYASIFFLFAIMTVLLQYVRKNNYLEKFLIADFQDSVENRIKDKSNKS